MPVSYDPVTGLPRNSGVRRSGPPVRFIQPNPLPDAAYGPGGPPYAGAPGGGGGQSPMPGVIGKLQAGMPDFQSIINELLGPLRADLAAQGISDANARKQATQRAFIQFGEVPDFTTLGLNGQYLGEDVDQATRDLATQNTTSGLSTVARIQKAQKDRLRMGRNQLAARGALQSGELGHFLGEEQLAGRQADTDARSGLIDLLSGIQAGYLESERRRMEAERAGSLEALLSGLDSPWMWPDFGSFGGGGGGPGNTGRPLTFSGQTYGGRSISDQVAQNLRDTNTKKQRVTKTRSRGGSLRRGR